MVVLGWGLLSWYMIFSTAINVQSYFFFTKRNINVLHELNELIMYMDLYY